MEQKVRHLDNIIDKDCTELADCAFKKSMFIGYVNKLRNNFRHLQPLVLDCYVRVVFFPDKPMITNSQWIFVRRGKDVAPY